MSSTGTRQGLTSGPRGPADVELVLSQIDSLPTLPVVAIRLLELTTDDRSSAREVVRLIESDQSLSARILSAVRRANVGARAATVEQAVVLLGFDLVRSMVLSIRIFETFPHRAESASTRFDRTAFWKHSLAVGCAARLLAEMTASRIRSPQPAPRPEESFVCGLLHDIGKVVLDACFPKSYDRVLAKVEVLRSGTVDVEREVFGVDHILAGRRLAMHWKLPAMIQECIWLHHHAPASTPTRISYPEHVRLVQLADRLVRQMRIGHSGNYSVDEPVAVTAAAGGIAGETIARVELALPELIEARAELIGLERLTSSEVYQEALTDANAELARVNLSLAETNRRLEQRSGCFEALRALHAGLGDEPMHEDVCRSAAAAARIIAPDGAVAVFAMSESRSILTLAALRQGSKTARVDVLPGSVAAGLPALPGWGDGWLPAPILPGALLDRLLAGLGEPAAWCWPIHHRCRPVGAIVTTTDQPPGADEPLTALSEGTGLWLSGAEARAGAQRINEELAEMNRRLVASQAEVARMRSLVMVGEMAAGAAHELNNPLAVISGRAQLLNRQDMNEEVRRSALVITEHAHRASQIVAELMDFAKPSPPEPSDWPLAALLGGIRRAWLDKNVLTEGQFRLELSDDLPKVRADASQIKKLFDELIRNAVEAMRHGPQPLLIINCQPDLADDRLVIRIEDNGCGMPPEVLERALDPFFSHRPAGRGRGLGLSRAARYAQINGGRIRLSSEVDKGTVVFVELPALVGD